MKGRKSTIAKIREHFDEKDVFPQLEEIAVKAVEANDGKVSMAVVLAAIGAATDLSFGAIPLRNMISRYGQFGKVSKTSVLGQLVRIGRGAPKGSCVGLVRNPHGRHGDPATKRSRAAKKGAVTRAAKLAEQTV